mmetsp:Transcript_94848/g.182875  ORF Transcript_94848/g.182875 Transcript_94848/m.182875 type:complete len:102 (+) Transcript_94848:408-713(+)
MASKCSAEFEHALRQKSVLQRLTPATALAQLTYFANVPVIHASVILELKFLELKDQHGIHELELHQRGSVLLVRRATPRVHWLLRMFPIDANSKMQAFHVV